MSWNLSDAKNRLSEVLDRVGREGPQGIRRRNEVFVVVREETYRELTGSRPSFTEFLLSGPREKDLEPMPRTPATMREPAL